MSNQTSAALSFLAVDLDINTLFMVTMHVEIMLGLLLFFAWAQNFSAMIEKAKPHGWIDEKRKAIKAHIEWTEKA